MQSPLKGIIPPIVTPLVARDELDVSGLERLVEHILTGGVSALFVLGTTGEGPSLSYRLRREMITRTCHQVRGRVPVLASITDTSFVESVNLARHAAEAGASAVVLAPPYYLPEGQPELLEYLDHLLAEVALPAFLYNLPSITKVAFELDTLQRAINHPRIVGLKDSSGNMTYFQHALGIARQRLGFSMLVGPEELLFNAVLTGAHGGVNGGANLFPRLYTSLYEASVANDLNRARQLHEAVLLISRSIYGVGKHSSAIIKGIKCALSCMGICDDFMAEPFHRFRAGERKRLQANLDEIQAALQRLQI